MSLFKSIALFSLSSYLALFAAEGFSQQHHHHRTPESEEMVGLLGKDKLVKNSPRLKEMIKLIKERELAQRNSTLTKIKKKVGLNTIKSKDTFKAPEASDIFYINHRDLHPITCAGAKSGELPGPSIVLWKDIQRLMKSGYVQKEQVLKGGLIKFIYNRGLFSSISRHIVGLKPISQIYGKVADSAASPRKILNFLQNALHLDINSYNVHQVNAEFKQLYGRGIDEFATVNELFARTLAKEAIAAQLSKLQAKEGDTIASSTSRTRVLEVQDVQQSFHLTDKNVGLKTNQFSVLRLFGRHQEKARQEQQDKYIAEKINKYAGVLARAGVAADSASESGSESGSEKEEDIAEISENIEEILPVINQVILNGWVKQLTNSYMVVHRLAPEDYHHFHFPFSSGVILSKVDILKELAKKAVDTDQKDILTKSLQLLDYIIKNYEGASKRMARYHKRGKLLSVSTLATTSRALTYSPLTENVRDIIFVQSPDYGIVPMVIVGAAVVGKNVIEVQAGSRPQMGEDMGHFEFGASTVVFFLPKAKAAPYPATQNLMNTVLELPSKGGSTTRQLESYMEMGTPLFYPIKK